MKFSRECILPNEPAEKRPLAITLATAGLLVILLMMIFIIGFTGYVIGEGHGHRDGFDHGRATGDLNCDVLKHKFELENLWQGTDETR